MDYDGHSVSASYESNLWNLTTCTISVFGTLHETKNWLLPHDVEFLRFYPKKWAEDAVKESDQMGSWRKIRMAQGLQLEQLFQRFDKQTKQRQQKPCYVLFIWIWRCDTTNSGHIGIREFQDLCQEFGIEEVVRGDIYCYYPFIGIDI